MINLILALLTFIMPSSEEEFCTCLPNGEITKKEYASYDLILEGRVLDYRDQGKVRFYKVKVDRMYKGAEQETIEISTYRESSLCGVDFNTGEKWLIYAFQLHNRYKTDLCTRTREMKIRSSREQVKNDLKFLRKMSRED